MWSNSSPTIGTQLGSDAFCWVKIQSVITTPTAARAMIAIVSLLRPRDWRESEARKVVQRLMSLAPPMGWARQPGQAPR